MACSYLTASTDVFPRDRRRKRRNCREDLQLAGILCFYWKALLSPHCLDCPNPCSQQSPCMGRYRSALPVNLHYFIWAGSLPYWNIIFKGSDSYSDNSAFLWENKQRKLMSCRPVDPHRVLFRVGYLHCQVQSSENRNQYMRQMAMLINHTKAPNR